MNYQDIIERIYHQVKSYEDTGKIATYIPELSKVDVDNFGIHLTTIDNQQFGFGDNVTPFSIQSISKVLSLVMAYKLQGEDLWKRLDVEPSGSPFNSLVQLEAENGIPRNPFINAGALVICDIIMSEYKDPKKEFLNFVRELSNNQHLNYAPKVVASEKSVGFRNVALCNFIKSFGNIKNTPEDVLDFYFHLCSIEMSCKELTEVFMFLANKGCAPHHQKHILTEGQSKRINAIMLTCGFYDESGEFSYKVGLPGKSGVGGGIIAVHPQKFTIAVWSPKLNPKGNSYKGINFLEEFTTQTKSSIF